MRIRFIQSYATTRDTFKRGDEHDAPDDEGAMLIDCGLAVAAVSGPPPSEITADAAKVTAGIAAATAELKTVIGADPASVGQESQTRRTRNASKSAATGV